MTTTTIRVLGLGDQEWFFDEWERYGTVEIRIGDMTYEVGASIGVPGYLRGTAEAAGGDLVTPYLDAWYGDSSDWSLAPRSDGGQGVPDDMASEVLAEIAAAAPRLWDERSA